MSLYTKILARACGGPARARVLERRADALLLAAHRAHQAQLNAFITVDRRVGARRRRRAADARAGRRRMRAPLTGVPLAHKDIFCTAGVRTTCGSRMLDKFVSPYDATVVAKLKAAGTVMLGKTNMDEFAMGSSNETSYYGPVQQPLGSQRSCRAAPRAARRPRWPRGWCRGDRHRHRRLDPPARGAVRRDGLQAHLRARVALRHDRVRLEPRSGRRHRRRSAEDAALLLRCHGGL